MTMKIAVITEDGQTISQHFGRAPYFMVLTIDDGKITGREMRSKLGHSQFHEREHGEGLEHAGHGMDTGSHARHVSMAEAISDCEALICGGMGSGAYESMRQLNIRPLITDVWDIDEAVMKYLDGSLIDHTELLH